MATDHYTTPSRFNQLVLDATVLVGYVATQSQNPVLPTFSATDRAYLNKQRELILDVILHLRTRSASSIATTSGADVTSALGAVNFAKQLFEKIGALPPPTKTATKAALNAAVIALQRV